MPCRTRIKYCGLGSPADVELAVALGVDAIGLVFYQPSPRAVSVALARQMAVGIPPLVTRVGLFLNAGPDDIRAVLARVPLDLLQFHGTEPAEFCAGFDLPYIKSVPMAETRDLRRVAEEYDSARALLLDSNLAGEPGGSGESFDWQQVQSVGKPLILAGGLTVRNVANAIDRLRPYAVDVSSGIESTRGIKDHALMRAFRHQVELADRSAGAAPVHAAAGTNERDCLFEEQR